MREKPEVSDEFFIDRIRQQGQMSVSELVAATGVTATAVRQRLNRLMGLGLLKREIAKKSRGRPAHRYLLTEKGQQQAGTNYGDLATVLWEELRSVKDPEVRRGLLQRVVNRFADHYKNSVRGDTIKERLDSIASLFGERKVPFEVDESGGLPVLTALACPYPDLAERDRSICAMEKMLFSEVLGKSVQLTSCRLDGSSCCTFEASAN